MCENCNPLSLKKVTPLFPSNPPLKVEVLSSPAPFLKIWLEVQTPPSPHPRPQQKGGGRFTLWVICGNSVAYFQGHLFYFQDILNLRDRYVSVHSITYYEVSIKIINEDLS